MPARFGVHPAAAANRSMVAASGQFDRIATRKPRARSRSMSSRLSRGAVSRATKAPEYASTIASTSAGVEWRRAAVVVPAFVGRRARPCPGAGRAPAPLAAGGRLPATAAPPRGTGAPAPRTTRRGMPQDRRGRGRRRRRWAVRSTTSWRAEPTNRHQGVAEVKGDGADPGKAHRSSRPGRGIAVRLPQRAALDGQISRYGQYVQAIVSGRAS